MLVLCKCCDAPADLFAQVDFSRTCDGADASAFALTGEIIAYYRCRACQFLFTPDFDALSNEEMAAKIYNDQYAKADPDFADVRPRYVAGLVRDALLPIAGRIAALDFGGGGGLLARLLRQDGFAGFDSYDPYFGSPDRPSGRYDLVTSFEVVEHVRDPVASFAEIISLLEQDGALLFSTSLQPHDVGAGWEYMAPRNGHVSLYSQRSLRIIAERFGVAFLSINGWLHLMYRSPPNDAARAIARCHAQPTLRHASLAGTRSLLAAARHLGTLGQGRAALDWRHAARALLADLGRRGTA